MNLDVLDEQKKLELDNQNSVNIDELKSKIDEYLKNNLESYEKTPLGQITIEKTAIEDINSIKENLTDKLEKIDKNIEIIKENTKDKNIIQEGLDDVYDALKGSVVEKIASKVLEKSKDAYTNIVSSKIGQRIIETSTNILEKCGGFFKNIVINVANIVKNVVK